MNVLIWCVIYQPSDLIRIFRVLCIPDRPTAFSVAFPLLYWRKKSSPVLWFRFPSLATLVSQSSLRVTCLSVCLSGAPVVCWGCPRCCLFAVPAPVDERSSRLRCRTELSASEHNDRWTTYARRFIALWCPHMVTAIKHPVPDRVKQSFVILWNVVTTINIWYTKQRICKYSRLSHTNEKVIGSGDKL